MRRKTKFLAYLADLGIAIISTSKGVMTDKQARQAQTGGEVSGLRLVIESSNKNGGVTHVSYW